MVKLLPDSILVPKIDWSRSRPLNILWLRNAFLVDELPYINCRVCCVLLARGNGWSPLQQAMCVCVCVCVCFRPIYFCDRPSDQGETCTTLCIVFRGLHLLVRRVFCQTRTHRGYTGGGKHRGVFYLCCPIVLCGAAFFSSREGFSRPSVSLVNNESNLLLVKTSLGYIWKNIYMRLKASKLFKLVISSLCEPLHTLLLNRVVVTALPFLQGLNPQRPNVLPLLA